MMAFGGVMVDSFGVIDQLPSKSLLTGLLGNALGYRRSEHERLQDLQDRIEFAVRVDRPGRPMTDYQTADLNKNDAGWTTRGEPEGRAGGEGTYEGQHQRYRDYHADASVTVALTLLDKMSGPSLQKVAEALDKPARPLFIGRKPCLPSVRLLIGMVDASSLLEAFAQAPVANDAVAAPRCYVRSDQPDSTRAIVMHGLRNWRANVHQGRDVWVLAGPEESHG